MRRLTLVNWGRVWIFLAVLATVFYLPRAGFSYGCETENSWLWWNYLLILGAIPVSLLVHEAGHAVMAVLVGFKVDRFALGVGRVVQRVRIGRLELQLRSIPLAGASVGVTPSDERALSRARMLISLLGGVAADIVLAAILYLTADNGLESLLGYAACQQSYLGVLFYVTILSIPANLIPSRTWRHMLVYNDGARAAQALVHPRVAASWLLSTPYIGSAAQALSEGRPDCAESILSSGIAKLPESFWLRMMRAGVRSRTQGERAGREELKVILTSYARSNLERAYCWNDIAYKDVLLDDPELLPEADEYSQLALRVAKMPPSIGTRGSVLLKQALSQDLPTRARRRRLFRSIRLLKKAYRSMAAQRTGKAADAAWLAIAYAHTGNDSAARRWLGKSRSKGHVPEYAAAETEVARTRGNGSGQPGSGTRTSL